MQFTDSVNISYMSDSISFFQDFTLTFLPDQNNSFQIMKFPVTNQLYLKYLQMILKDSLVSYNSETESITGFFPGTESSPEGNYDFYVEEKGRIIFINNLV